MVSCFGLLVQLCCGEGGVLQTNVSGLCGEHSWFSGHIGFAPLAGVCFPSLHCSGSQLLYREGAGPALREVRFQVIHNSMDSVGPAFCAFPARAAQAARSLTDALSPVRCAFSPPWSQPQFPRMLVGFALCLCWGAGL